MNKGKMTQVKHRCPLCQNLYETWQEAYDCLKEYALAPHTVEEVEVDAERYICEYCEKLFEVNETNRIDKQFFERKAERELKEHMSKCVLKKASRKRGQKKLYQV